MENDLPEVYTLDEAAELLKVSRRSIYRLLIDARLPVFRVGMQWRLRRSVVEDVLNGKIDLSHESAIKNLRGLAKKKKKTA